jgi:hypothetical protein
MPKQKRQDIVAILTSVFPEVAKFATRSDGLVLALVSPDLVKFAKLMHPMLYDLWPSSDCRAPNKVLYALSCLDWGKWGRGKVLSYCMLQFVVDIVGVPFHMRLELVRSHLQGAKKCHVYCSVKTRGDDFVSFNFKLPKVIARHQIRKSLFPLFAKAYNTLKRHIISYFNENPYLIVGQRYSQDMTSALWRKVADKFAELEQECARKEDDLSDLEDDFSAKK